MRSRVPYFAIAFVMLVAGCSSSEATFTAGGGAVDSGGGEAGDSVDAGHGGDEEVILPGFARLTGRAVQMSNNTMGVPATAVTAGTQMATSDAAGSWSIMLPTAQPFSLVLAAGGYATLTEESATLSGNYDSGARPLIDRSIGQLLVGSLANFDNTLGMIAINVVAEPSCPSEEGATLIVTAGTTRTGGGAQGDPQLVYFVGGLPSPAATGAQKGTTPAAIAYNLPLGEVTVAAQHPTCVPDVSPVTQGPITYQGKVQVVAAQTASSTLALSFLRAFLK